MLKKEIIAKFEALGFKYADLEKAIKDEAEVYFTLPEIKNYSDADLSARDENTRKEGVKEGKKAGIGIAGKILTEKFGLKEVDHNDPDKIVEALNASFSKGDEALKDQVKQLQAQNAAIVAEKEKTAKELGDALFDRDLITHFPQNRDSRMTDAEFLQLVKMNLAFEDADGVKVAKRGTEILRDPTTKNPLPIADAIKSVFGEKKWITEQQQQGGRGAGDHQQQGGIKKLSQFMENWEKDGKDPMSAEFQAALSAHAKSITDFDMAG